MATKKILYFDMDNVLVDFPSGISRLSEETKKEYEGRLDDVPGIFSLMDPMPGAIEAVKLLSQYFDCYILSTAPWKNISAWSEKVAWVQKYFGDDKENPFFKRLIISHHKNLIKGDYLIDDRTKNGAGEFDGELIQFGSVWFPDRDKWDKVVQYLMEKEKLEFIRKPEFEQLNIIVKNFNFDVPCLQTEHELKALYYELQFKHKDIWYQVQQLSVSESKKKLFFIIVALIDEDFSKKENYKYIFLLRYTFNQHEFKKEALQKVYWGNFWQPVEQFLIDVIDGEKETERVKE